MPYISHNRDLARLRPDTPGELNYAISMLVKDYIARHELSYTSINAAVGALECAKLECYRRIAEPYEDAAKEKNGDVF